MGTGQLSKNQNKKRASFDALPFMKQSVKLTFRVYKSGAITRATMLINLMRMFIEGPEVSLNGSPTVSPTTAAL